MYFVLVYINNIKKMTTYVATFIICSIKYYTGDALKCNMLGAFVVMIGK